MYDDDDDDVAAGELQTNNSLYSLRRGTVYNYSHILILFK